MGLRFGNSPSAARKSAARKSAVRRSLVFGFFVLSSSGQSRVDDREARAVGGVPASGSQATRHGSTPAAWPAASVQAAARSPPPKPPSPEVQRGVPERGRDTINGEYSKRERGRVDPQQVGAGCWVFRACTREIQDGAGLGSRLVVWARSLPSCDPLCSLLHNPRSLCCVTHRGALISHPLLQERAKGGQGRFEHVGSFEQRGRGGGSTCGRCW